MPQSGMRLRSSSFSLDQMPLAATPAEGVLQVAWAGVIAQAALFAVGSRIFRGAVRNCGLRGRRAVVGLQTFHSGILQKRSLVHYPLRRIIGHRNVHGHHKL